MQHVLMGSFHGVTAVGVGKDSVSILGSDGIERLLKVRPNYNRTLQGFDPITVRGEFGSLDGAKAGEVLEGVMPQRVTAVEIDMDFQDEDEDFHCRSLKVTSSQGVVFTWELYCEGKAD